MPGSPTAVLVTDFDGTVTRREFYQVVRDRLMGPAPPDYWAAYRAGEMTHFEAMARYCRAAGTDEAVARELAGLLEPDPRFAELVDELAARGWQVVVASAGSDWYIKLALAAVADRVAVHANRGTWVAGRGLVLEPAGGSPFADPDVGVNKAAVVRDALARARTVAFAGDGVPDLPAALLVRPGLRFARGDLAAELDRRREGYRPFGRWADVGDALLGEPLP